MATLTDFVSDIKKKYGDIFSTQDDDIEVISTGSISLDLALGIKGIPLGRFIEIFGPEGSGKTTLAINIANEFIKKGKAVLYLDVENMFSIDYASNIIENLDPEYFIVARPESGESALLLAEEVLNSDVDNLGLIVLDSVGAMAPEREKGKSLTDATVAETARLLAKFLRRVPFKVRTKKVAFIFINQVRANIGSYYGGYTTPGGNTLKHMDSIIIKLGKGKKILVNGDVVGVNSPFTITKNKLSMPYKEGLLPIIEGKGVHKIYDVVQTAKSLGVIKTRGSYMVYDGEVLGQGIRKTLEYLENSQETLDKIVEECYTLGTQQERSEEDAEVSISREDLSSG